MALRPAGQATSVIFAYAQLYSLWIYLELCISGVTHHHRFGKDFCNARTGSVCFGKLDVDVDVVFGLAELHLVDGLFQFINRKEFNRFIIDHEEHLRVTALGLSHDSSWPGRKGAFCLMVLWLQTRRF